VRGQTGGLQSPAVDWGKKGEPGGRQSPSAVANNKCTPTQYLKSTQLTYFGPALGFWPTIPDAATNMQRIVPPGERACITPKCREARCNSLLVGDPEIEISLASFPALQVGQNFHVPVTTLIRNGYLFLAVSGPGKASLLPCVERVRVCVHRVS
jgi:hypothetical protein